MKKKDAVQIDYAIAKGQKYFEAKQYAKKGAGTWFSKLGQSLVAVVVVLPFAGLFAAVGGIVMSLVKNNEAAYTVGLILSDLGQTVLSNLGLLFMLAILIGFTNAKGYAIFSSIIGYIAFVGFITPFIRYPDGTAQHVTDSAGKAITILTDPQSFNIWFWHGLSSKTQLSNIFGLGQAGLAMDPGKIGAHGEFARLSYKGFTTLNTGVLGGIVLGFIDVWIYNKGKDLKLPNMLSFFSGEKFTSVVALCVSPIVASLFIIVWPGVNYILGEIGVGLTYLPYGIDAGVFGIAKQLLIPFEAHQALIAPLWYTAAGGSLQQSQADVIAAMMYRIVEGHTAGIGQEANFITNTVEPWAKGISAQFTLNGVQIKETLWQWIQSNFGGSNAGNYSDKLKDITNSFDLFSAAAVLTNGSGTPSAFIHHISSIQSALGDYSKLDWTISGDQLMTMAVLNNNPKVDIRDFWDANLKITRFITGGYANLMFLTPAVGLAIWSTLPKGPRKRKFAFYFGAMMPSFLLGVNEPIIFMFAYTAPIIYYFWYSGVCGILFLFTALFQAKLSSTFSQGLLDYVVNGVIPTVTRTGEQGAQQTMLWVPLIIGIITFFAGFVLFRFLFIKGEFMAPGMEESIDNENKGQSVYTKTKPLVTGFIDYLDGIKSIQSVEWNGPLLTVKTKKPWEYKKNAFSDAMFDQVIISKDGTINLVLQKQNDDIKRAIEYVQTLVYYATHKSPKLTSAARLNQRVAKVKAQWQIKHDSLDTTNDIEKATEAYKEKLWSITEAEDREIAKVSGQKLKPLSDNAKQEAKRLAESYRTQVKQLKKENDAKIKAERHAGKKSKAIEQK